MTRWTIAILTVPGKRDHLFNRVYNMLARQIGDRDIELLVASGPDSVAAKRQWCLDNAQGEYFNFVDDDDLVSKHYVDTIYPLLDGVDYIGFRLQLYIDGAAQKPTFHSLKYDRWWEDQHGYYRNVSHLNPMRIDIARAGRFIDGYGEDRRWAQQVFPRSEHFIDKVMYHYYFSPGQSLTWSASQ